MAEQDEQDNPPRRVTIYGTLSLEPAVRVAVIRLNDQAVVPAERRMTITAE